MKNGKYKWNIYRCFFFPYSRLKEFNRYKVSAVINMKDFISCSEGMNSPLLLIQKRYLHRNIASERIFFICFSCLFLLLVWIPFNVEKQNFLGIIILEEKVWTSIFETSIYARKWFYSFELVWCLWIESRWNLFMQKCVTSRCIN